MKGYLIQIKNLDDEIYWTPIEFEEEIIITAFRAWAMDDTDEEFEEWWNKNNSHIQIKRVFVKEIWV